MSQFERKKMKVVGIELNHRIINTTNIFFFFFCPRKTSNMAQEDVCARAPTCREAHRSATKRPAAEMLTESPVSDRANTLKWSRGRRGKTPGEQILAVKTVTASICDAESDSELESRGGGRPGEVVSANCSVPESVGS